MGDFILELPVLPWEPMKQRNAAAPLVDLDASLRPRSALPTPGGVPRLTRSVPALSKKSRAFIEMQSIFMNSHRCSPSDCTLIIFDNKVAEGSQVLLQYSFHWVSHWWSGRRAVNIIL